MYKIPANTLFLSKNVVFVPECHSTNALAADLAEGAPEGTVVITYHQTAGRGQRGNSWQTAPGLNFTLSIIFYPHFLSPAQQFALNIFSSLAVADYLQRYVYPPGRVKIKWPNDVMIDNKKACGILIENQITQRYINKSIVGVGLNINQTKFEHATACSLALVTDLAFDLTEEFERLMEFMEARYLQLKQGKMQHLHEEYLSLLYWRNEMRNFKTAHGELEGVITGIDESGKLVVSANEALHCFDLKEITYLS